MKLKFIFSLLFLLLVLGNVSAIDIQVKDSFLHNENFVAKVYADFYLPLTKDNIYFYRRHLPTAMANYDLLEIEGTYYITADIPLEKVADNYSIVIKDSLYLIGGKLYSEDLIGNFSILEGEVSFTIDPNLESFIDNYSFSLTNLKSNSLEVDYTNSEGSFGTIVLNPFETKQIFFVSDSIGLKTIKFNSSEEKYNSLAYVSSLTEPFVATDNCTPAGYDCIGFCEGKILSEYTCLAAEVCCLTFENPKEDNLTEENVTENFDSLENETDENKSFWDAVRDLFGGKGNETEKEDNFTLEENETEGLFNSALQTCDELGFKICEEEEICEGDTEYGKDSLCCKGNCIIEEESSTGKIIGWSILVALILFGTWFFKKKFNGTKRSSSNLLKK